MEQKRDLQLQVFSDGQALELSDINIESLNYLSDNLNINQQFDLLIGHFTSLVKTVNINAAFLRNYITRSKEKKHAEDFLHEALEQFNLYIQKLDPTSSQLISSSDDLIKEVDYNWGKTLSDHNEACKLLVKSIIRANDRTPLGELESKLERITENLEIIEKQTLETKSKIDYIAQESSNFSNLKQEIDLIKSEFEKTTFKFLTPENLEKSSIFVSLADKLHNSEQGLLDLGNKISLLSTNLNSLVSQNQHSSNNRQGENLVRAQLFEEIDKLRDVTVQNHQSLEKKVQSLEEDFNDRIQDAVDRFKEIPLSGVKTLPTSLGVRENLNTGSGSFKPEWESMLQKQEKIFLKKILVLENNIRDLNDLRKFEKITQRIQIELNSKVGQELFGAEISSKLDRNEFFDFINKNLVSTDQMKTFNLELTKSNREFKERMIEFDVQAKKLKKLNEGFQGEIRQDKLAQSEQISSLSKRIEECHSNTSKNLELLKEMEKDQSEFRSKLQSLLAQRINSLATTRSLRCLSCGQKDIPYPHALCYIEGENNHLFIKENKEADEANNSDIKENHKNTLEEMTAYHPSPALSGKTGFSIVKSSKYNGASAKRLLSAVGFLKKSEPASSPKYSSPFPNKTYLTGQQLSTSKQIAIEHTAALHYKTDPSIKAKENISPFSSVLKNSLFRIA